MSNMKKPKQFLIYKIIGFTGIAFIITGIILLPIGIDKFYATHGDSYLDMFAAILIMAGLAMSVVGLVAGFSPPLECRNEPVWSVSFLLNKNDT